MEEKQKFIEEKLIGQDLFKVKGVNSVNHKPHPYMIGPKHIEHSQKYGRMLGEQTLNEVNCSHPGCYLKYKDHTSDLVCFLQLTRNGTNDEANVILKKLVDDLGKNYIDGFSFVETVKKFRIN